MAKKEKNTEDDKNAPPVGTQVVRIGEDVFVVTDDEAKRRGLERDNDGVRIPGQGAGIWG